MTDQTAPLALPRRVPAADAGGHAADLPWPVALYLFCVVIPIGFDVGPLFLTTLRILLMALVVPLTVQLLAGRYGRIRATDLLFLAFLLWQVVALGVNNPARVVELVGSTGIEFWGGYMVGRAYIRTPQSFEALARTFVLVVLTTLPFAIYETFTSQSPLLDMLRAIPGMVTASNNGTEERMGLIRVQFTFAHQIHFGLFASLAFSLAFVALKGRIGTAWRYVASGGVALCVFLALSSGPLLALVLQGGLIAWGAIFAGMRRRWYLLIGLFAFAYVAIDLLSTRTPISVFMSYATFSPHTAFYRAAIFEHGMRNVWGSPIFGIGLNPWVRPAYMFDGSVDNFWLVAAMRFGIPGFLLVAAGYLLGLLQVMRRDFSTDPVLDRFRLAWVFTFLSLAFTLSTVALWTNIYSFVFFMFATGLWLIEARPAGAPAPGPAVPARGRGSATRRDPGPALAPAPTPALAPALAPGLAPVPAESAAPPPAPGPRYTRFPPAGRGGASRPGP